MNIAGLLKTATIDFPRRLAAVVFTAGCNYDCGFCHNRGLLDAADFKDNGEVLRFLEKRAGLLDGVVISGGEPTLQKDLAGFAATLKELGYDVKLDTNGSNPQMVGRLLDGGLVDYVAMDYKAPLARYPEVCGAGADGFLETLGLLWDSGIEWEPVSYTHLRFFRTRPHSAVYRAQGCPSPPATLPQSGRSQRQRRTPWKKPY